MTIDDGDIADDMAGGAWMTYGQLADARAISRRAAIRLTQRHRWRRQKGNDGFARVFVPDDMTTPRGDDTATIDADADDDVTTGDRHILAGALAALEDAVAGLREQVGTANRRADDAMALADRTLAQLADAEARADRAEGRAEALRDRLDAAEAQLVTAEAAADLARRHAQEAQEAAEALRPQIDVLNAEMVEMRHEADRQLAEERLRADQLSEQVDAGHRDLDAARAEARTAQEAGEALRRAEAERQARGLVARLRAAWRGK